MLQLIETLVALLTSPSFAHFLDLLAASLVRTGRIRKWFRLDMHDYTACREILRVARHSISSLLNFVQAL